MEFWVFFYAGLFLAGFTGIAFGWVLLEVMDYVNTGWKKYTLTENEWDRLRLHEQTLERSKW